MNKRRLGQTGLEVSEVAFGAWQLGNYDQWGGMTDADALNLVAAARDRGCNLFDTAPNYAKTNSERLLGQALKGQRDQVVIVSKFGHRPKDGALDFSAEWFWESLHQSLERLQTDHLDVMLAHSPPLEVLNGNHEIWPAMREAQKQGKIRFYGASTDYSHEVNEVLDTTDAQVLELLFNVLHQDVRRSFDKVREKDVGVITKVPLDSGWLSGKYTASSTFDGVRARWSADDIAARAKAVETVKTIVGDSAPLAQQALAYLLSYNEVTAVIPGIRSMAQLDSNFAAVGTRLSDDVKAQLEAFWNELTDNGQSLLPW
ncbi:aldo/keto reductase [Reinekea blandensis]|uniref:Putative oxidoreductase n=1 Tax=Reinekea blandensis MED297 TaxID=314283 RepID=A4BF67_9GAMM|nr:aldo/keto reductase [Reinekea blandensis]EAR09180.1 putative oxidoreductase [Reinekea sp. MED297] [Reinekea blandensis MED297]